MGILQAAAWLQLLGRTLAAVLWAGGALLWHCAGTVLGVLSVEDLSWGWCTCACSLCVCVFRSTVVISIGMLQAVMWLQLLGMAELAATLLIVVAQLRRPGGGAGLRRPGGRRGVGVGGGAA
jgi:hypothetical protein